MRHKYKGRKLGTSYAHTKAMKRSLVKALFLNDRIKTIESRAKEIRPDVDKIITWAKKGDLHSRRLSIAALGNDSELVREIFDKVDQGMFADRNGGYTRIIKLGPRKGDNAPMVIMELITESLPSKKKTSTTAKEKAKKIEDSDSKDTSKNKEESTEQKAENSKEEPKKDSSKEEAKKEEKPKPSKQAPKKAPAKKEEVKKEPETDKKEKEDTKKADDGE